jgi:hypothetical protein
MKCGENFKARGERFDERLKLKEGKSGDDLMIEVDT